MPLDDIPSQAGRVLFVDDDAFYRDLASEALASAGYDVKLASDGRMALNLLAQNRFDLIVLDIAMPGLSGFDVLTQIRGTPSLVDLPVLVITGNDDAESVVRAFDLGATSFLGKPLNWLLFVYHVQFVQKAARTQADLRQATRTAEFMSDLKSRLVGTLVTEFQSPLRSALGFARLLKEEADGPIESSHYRAWIGDLHTAVERLGATHVKMLNFGRALADSIVIEDEPVELAPLIVSVLQSASTVAARRQLTLTFDDLLPKGLQLQADSVFLTQALRGVIDNAVRLSRRKTIISVAAVMDPAGNIVVRITDTCPPLTPAQTDEIFGVRPFAPAKAETVETTTGLKLTRVLVEAHQGLLRLHSNSDVGLISELQLPAHRIIQPALPDATADRLWEASRQLQAAIRKPGTANLDQVPPLRSAIQRG
jgi:CheY-like chemotaxis protein